VLDLDFRCMGARAATWAAAPTLLFDLQIIEETGRRIYAIGLHCQIRLDPIRRRYSSEEESALLELFGDPARWGRTLHPIQVATVSTLVPGFTGTITVEIPLPCTYDTEVAAAKYFRSLDDGEIPLMLLFSGSVYFPGGDGLVVENIPWDRECAYRLPVKTWQELMDAHFPGTGWLRLQTETLEALQRYRRTRMLPSWEDTFAALLEEARVRP
jgi:hypothetical protein